MILALCLPHAHPASAREGPDGDIVTRRDSPDDSELVRMFTVFRPSGKIEARFGTAIVTSGSPNDGRGVIWPLFWAFEHTPPVGCSERGIIGRLTLALVAAAVVVPRSAANLLAHLPWEGHLDHLEGDVAAVAHDLRADLDQLFLQARQRPVLDRFRRRQRAQEVAEIVGERMKLQGNAISWKCTGFL